MYNLEKGSGFYRKFNAIIPYSLEDLKDEKIPSALMKLPFKLKKKNIDFFVISDDVQNSFYIKEESDKVLYSLQKADDYIECKLFKDCLKYI